jgi:hypothetical protein
MFNIKIRIELIKESKDIEKRIISILEELKTKYKSQNYEINFKNKNLNFEINSNLNTVTDILVQFEKKAKETLGKEFKTSIKEIIIEYYAIEVDLEEKPKKEITIPIANKIKFNNKKLEIE